MAARAAARAVEAARRLRQPKKPKGPKVPCLKGVLKPQMKKVERKWQNFSRSATGERLIMQEMEDIYKLDLHLHPKRPLFDSGHGGCRLQPLDVDVLC